MKLLQATMQCNTSLILTCDFSSDHEESLDKSLIWRKRLKKIKVNIVLVGSSSRKKLNKTHVMWSVDCAAREEYTNKVDLSVSASVQTLFRKQHVRTLSAWGITFSQICGTGSYFRKFIPLEWNTYRILSTQVKKKTPNVLTYSHSVQIAKLLQLFQEKKFIFLMHQQVALDK